MSSAPSPSSEKEQLELRKLEAEARKAEVELAQAQGVFAKLGRFFTPLVAALTIVLGYLAATHSQRVAQAELSKARADLEAQRALNTKEIAERDLVVAQTKLEETNKRKGQAEKALRNTQSSLKQLQDQNEALQEQHDRRIKFGDLQKLINILDSDPADRRTADSRSIEDIKREVVKDPALKESRLAFLITAAQNQENSPALRALLYYATFQATNDNQWMDQIRRLASARALDAWPTFLSLLKSKYFDARDRGEVLCAAYHRALQKHESGKELFDDRRRLFTLGRDAVLRCREPYFDHLQELRPLDSGRKEFIKAFAEPESDSPVITIDTVSILESIIEQDDINPTLQALVIWYLIKHSKLDLYALDVSMGDLSVDLNSAVSEGTTGDWMRRHEKLVKAWTEKDFTLLRKSSDGTMVKILSGEWIAEADLP
jgi:hypothetical protein